MEADPNAEDMMQSVHQIDIMTWPSVFVTHRCLCRLYEYCISKTMTMSRAQKCTHVLREANLLLSPHTILFKYFVLSFNSISGAFQHRAPFDFHNRSGTTAFGIRRSINY